MNGIELRRRLLQAKPVVRAKLVARLPREESDFFESDFQTFSHHGQLPPRFTEDGGDWRTWLLMAGRGYGKTRAGAEWVLSLVRGDEIIPPRVGEDLSRLHIALVAATVEEARAVMVEGDSGLLALARPDEIADWSPSLRTLRFDNGAMATLYSGARGESLRGPQHNYAWCDELAKWAQAENAWNNLQLGLRVGAFPRALVTTTPRNSVLLERIRDAPDTVETGGSTTANPHLPPVFVAAMERQYGGTRLGAQEIEGILLTDVEGSLWSLTLIERCRISPSRLGEVDYTRTVIGVDPPASAGGTCGIIVCALDAGGHGHVLADCSVGGTSPDGWAAAVARAAEIWGADRVVAEKNQGGDMVEAVLRAASANLPLRLVHAAKGKSARAEPVAALFEQGKVWLHGRFDDLEAQLSGLIAGGGYEGPSASPDRADACVWALWALMLAPQAAPLRISVL